MKQITPRRWLIAARNWYVRREARHRAGKAVADAILTTSRSVEDALTLICAIRAVRRRLELRVRALAPKRGHVCVLQNSC